MSASRTRDLRPSDPRRLAPVRPGSRERPGAASWAVAIGAAVLIGVGLSAAVHATTADGRAAARSEIVFVSERPWSNPGGEIYALKPGSAPKDISSSPFADTAMAVAPHAERVAFWSNRSGPWQVYLARWDGSDLRPLAGATL